MSIPPNGGMAEYSKDQMNDIVRSVSFVNNMCTALNIINDAVAMNGDILIKKDVAQIQRAHDILKDIIQQTVDGIKRKTDGEFDFSFESF